MAAYAAWMTVLLVAYYALPGFRAGVWGVLALSGVTAIVAGVVLNRPASRAPWLLLAAANLCFAVGQQSFLILTEIRHQVIAFPSFVDLFYLASYPLYAIGLLIFIRRRSAGHDWRSLLDALAMLARLLAPGTWRSRSLQLLTAGSLGLLASDVAFGATQLYGSWHVGTSA